MSYSLILINRTGAERQSMISERFDYVVIGFLSRDH